MTRAEFLSILGLGLLGCEEEEINIRRYGDIQQKDMKIKHLNWFWGGVGDPTTNSQGQQVIAFIGDSNIVGQGLTVGPTPTAGTVKQWSGGSIIDVTNTDITEGLTTGQQANIGSMMPKFGIDYNARTGKIPVIVSCGRGGSHFASNPDLSDNDFSSTGDNRALTEARITAALAANGTTKLGEIIVNLGINDFTAANTFATISAAIDSFVTWLTTTYPGVRITFLQIGRTSAGIVSTKQSQIRNKLRTISEANTGIHLIHAPVPLYDYGYYNVDLLHYSQAGNNFLGAAIDDYFEAVDDSAYDKFAAAIFCSFKDTVDTTKKNAINVFVSKYKNTNLALCETFQIYKGDTQANTYLDWVGMLSPVFTSVSFSANTEIATSAGTGSFIDTQWMTDQQLIRVTSDQDINFGCRVGSKTSIDALTACLYGAVGSSDNTSNSLFQTLSNTLQWRVMEDGTTSTILAATSVVAESLYELVRTGAATCSLWKDGVKLQDGTTAYEGTLDRTMKLGGRSNSASTVSSPIAAGFKCYYVATASGFDRTDWDADLDTLLNSL